MPWIVTELVRGESLQEVLRRGPVDPAEAARIGLSVLGAPRAVNDMPEGIPGEKKGTAVFKGARDRLDMAPVTGSRQKVRERSPDQHVCCH